MNPNFSCRSTGAWTIVEFLATDMTDLQPLEAMHLDLSRYLDKKKPQRVILDFEKVQYVSSKAIVIILDISKRLGTLPHGRLVLCAVPPKIMELLKTLNLDKILRIAATQSEAIAAATT